MTKTIFLTNSLLYLLATADFCPKINSKTLMSCHLEKLKFKIFCTTPNHNGYCWWRIAMVAGWNSCASYGPQAGKYIVGPCFSGYFATLKVYIQFVYVWGNFPSVLKKDMVIALHKKEDKYKLTNYHPIPLMSNIGQVFEKIVHQQIYEYLHINSKFYKRQFGFRAKHSTAHAISGMTEFI